MGSRSRDKGVGECWGPVAELSLPRFAILTAVYGTFRTCAPHVYGATRVHSAPQAMGYGASTFGHPSLAIH